MANTATFISIDSVTQGDRIGTDTALTGTVTFTNGSGNVTGSGTNFLTSITPLLGKGGVYIRDNAQSPTLWTRVSSVTNDTALILIQGYQGTGGSGLTAHKGVSVYGTEGGDCISDAEAFYPSYLTVTTNGNRTTQQVSGNDVTPVCMGFNGPRQSNVYYSTNPATDLILHLSISGGLQHQFWIYFQDSTNRTQTIAILDGTDHTTVLDAARSVTGNMTTAPSWFGYNVGGDVDIVLSGANYQTYQCIAFNPLGGDPLTAGTVSVSSVGVTTLTVSTTAATGGTP